MNILVVDDQRVMRELSKAVIAQMGHTVFEADCGEAALDCIGSEKINLILLDVEMPGINGFETATSIRQQSDIWFPIIFLSTKTDSEYFVNGIRSGGDAYLHKPVVPEVLEAMIKAMERIFASQEELHQAKVKMEHLANQDSLTGLINRRGFDKIVQLEFKKAYADKKPLTLMLLDVDYFKKYNDNHGHQAGDECLAAVAANLRKAVFRDKDYIARYGGEEFVLIMPDTDQAGAEVVAGRVSAAMADHPIHHGFSDVAEHVTLSGGIAVLDKEMSVKELVELADSKLYQAKKSGRNRIFS